MQWLQSLLRTQEGERMKPSTYYMGNGHSKYGIYNKKKKLFDRSGLASLLFMGAVSAFLVLAIDYYMFATLSL